MPNPHRLRVGDQVQFTRIPSEWDAGNFFIQAEDRLFMDQVVAKGRWYKVYEIDEYNHAWVSILIYINKRREHHTWAITESTGWRSRRS